MKFKVTGQELEILSSKVISEGAVNFVTFELCCDESWNGFAKTVRFAHQDSEEVFDIPDVDEGVAYYVPAEVLTKGMVYVGVVGVQSTERVATTSKAFFTVDEAVEGGKTPSVTADAYAKYVRDVTEHRRASEEAKKVSLECLEKCTRLKEDADTFARSAILSKRKTERILEEVSGMLDAVSMAFRSIKQIEEGLASLNGNLSRSELERDGAERARSMNERKRACLEEQRKSSEDEREAAEMRRCNAEDMRVSRELERDRKLRDMNERLSELEDRAPLPLSYVTVKEEGNGSIELSDMSISSLNSVSVYGETVLREGKLHGKGEMGYVCLTVGADTLELPVSSPLYSVGSAKDELTLGENGDITVVRRTASYVVGSSASFICDDRREGRVMYVTPFNAHLASDQSGEGVSSAFSYGLSADRDSVWISGEYVFFCLDAEKYPDVPSLCKALEDAPLTLIYPVMKPYAVSEGSVYPISPSIPVKVSYDGELSVSYTKDIFKAIENINARLDRLDEKEKENDNDNTEKVHVA